MAWGDVGIMGPLLLAVEDTPAGSLWNPDVDGPRLAGFMPVPDSAVGVEIQNGSTNVNARNIEVDNASTQGITIANSTGVVLDTFTIQNSDGNGLAIVSTPTVAGADRAVIARNGTLLNNGGGPVAQADLFVIGSRDVELTDITSTGYDPTLPNQGAVFLSGATDVAVNNVDVSGIGGSSGGITVGNNSQDITITH